MNIIGDYKGEKLVIALGFFDSLHKGHRALIEEAKALSERCGARCAVFTFSGNPYFIRQDERKVILTFDERCAMLKELGVDYVVSAQPTEQFFAKSAEEFLTELVSSFSVAGLVSGTDYTFGKGAKGNCDFIKAFCADRSVEFTAVELVKSEGKKIATRDISALIAEGKVDEASRLLGYGYFIRGEVRRGRGDGKRSCVPTVNMEIQDGKVVPRRGVYATETTVDGRTYRSVTNVGGHPTFQDFTENVETFVLDFDGDVYGKTVTVSFKKYLREISTFSSPDELRRQIERDAEISRSTPWKI